MALISPTRRPAATPRPRISARTLRDGAFISLRLATPADDPALQAMFARLSPSSIYRRLFLAAPNVPHWAARFVELVRRDDPGAGAIVAHTSDQIIGIANFAREVDGTTGVAIVVEDAWQSRGVGHLLIAELLAELVRRRISLVSARVLGDNPRALALARATLPNARIRWAEGEYQLLAPTTATPAS
jgi:GNAT superfamily N-acetyltransferase